MVQASDIDWSLKGAVTKVKNQGSCGSCWAFSATGVVQSWNIISRNLKVQLSEQQLVDCTSNYGNMGCVGGYPQRALQYIKKQGITLQKYYPYVAHGQTCQRTGGDIKINYIYTADGCSGLQHILSSRPLSVTVDAANWDKYQSGIFNNCGRSLNHAVLLVGILGGNWKVKNSWGTTWGQNGYIRLAGANTCGICSNGGWFIQ